VVEKGGEEVMRRIILILTMAAMVAVPSPAFALHPGGVHLPPPEKSKACDGHEQSKRIVSVEEVAIPETDFCLVAMPKLPPPFEPEPPIEEEPI
jgi:hypothetical protein